MDSDVRHELEQNELADWLTRTGHHLRPWLPYLFGVMVLAAVGGVAAGFMWSASDEAKRESWNVLAAMTTKDGLEQIASEQQGSDVATLAELKLGWIRYNEAKLDILASRGESLRLLDESIESFEKVVANSDGSSAYRAQAMLGIGLAKECQAKVQEAKEAYQAVIDRFAKEPMGQIAQLRLDKLHTEDAASFYASMKSYQPPEPTTELPTKIDTGLDPTATPVVPDVPFSIDNLTVPEPPAPSSLPTEVTVPDVTPSPAPQQPTAESAPDPPATTPEPAPVAEPPKPETPAPTP